MKLHESAPSLLGPALGVQKPVIKKLKENFLRSLIIESFMGKGGGGRGEGGRGKGEVVQM